jgi:hypothetical protein
MLAVSIFDASHGAGNALLLCLSGSDPLYAADQSATYEFIENRTPPKLLRNVIND